MIQNLDLEQRLLAGLIRFPNAYGDIANFISEEDFYADENNITRTLFSVIKEFCSKGAPVDEVVLSERVKALGFAFAQDIDLGTYIHALSMQKVQENKIISIAQELKKITVRRQIYTAAKNTALKVKALDASEPYENIIDIADKTFNEKINVFDSSDGGIVNIFDEMEEHIEDLGNNPKEEMGLMGPYERVNDLYGSLLRPGNITLITARSGSRKSTMAMDFTIKTSARYDIPVLHFDNGEMSKSELIIRECSALSGVSSHLLETGQWRQAGQEVVDKVRAVWSSIKDKKLKFYYHGVGGYSLDKMISVLKRFYYSKVGRGNQMIFSFDYIKPLDEDGGKNEWQVVGAMLNRFKAVIQNEIICDNDPVISMFTSVQSNRAGIIGNRTAAQLTDDEGIISMSDRLTHYASHVFILRTKTLDEITNDGPDFGTHKFINVKSRHLGRMAARALNPVGMPNGETVKNCIHLNIQGFNVECIGDQQDLADHLSAGTQLSNDNDDDQDDASLD